MTQCRRMLHPSRCVFLSSSHAAVLAGPSPALKLPAFRAGSRLFCCVCSSGQGRGSVGAPAMLQLSTPLCYYSYRRPMASAPGGVCQACSSRLADGLETWLPVCELLHQVGPERMRAWMRLIGWERGQNLSQADAKQPLSVFPQPAQTASVRTSSCRKATIQGRCKKGSSASPCQSRSRVKSCFHFFVEGAFERRRIAPVKIPY